MIFYSPEHELPRPDHCRAGAARRARAVSAHPVKSDHQTVKLHHRILLLIVCVVAMLWLVACVIITLDNGQSAMFTFPGAAMAGFLAYATFRGAIGRSWTPQVDETNVDG